MRLTRRDALAALTALGAAGATAALAGRSPPVAGDESSKASDGGGASESGERVDAGSAESGDRADVAVVDALTAAAEVLYPSAVEGHREFVETVVRGRTDGRSVDREGLVRTVADLDATARDWYGAPFADLSPGERDDLLRQLGVASADPDPDGPIFARIRYHVVDDLLFALYASPTGGRLVGIENPVGYPGGTRSYRRARMPAADDGEGAGEDGEGAGETDDDSDPVEPSDVWVGVDDESSGGRDGG